MSPIFWVFFYYSLSETISSGIPWLQKILFKSSAAQTSAVSFLNGGIKYDHFVNLSVTTKIQSSLPAGFIPVTKSLLIDDHGCLGIAKGVNISGGQSRTCLEFCQLIQDLT